MSVFLKRNLSIYIASPRDFECDPLLNFVMQNTQPSIPQSAVENTDCTFADL